jgi:hypothetical protein
VRAIAILIAVLAFATSARAQSVAVEALEGDRGDRVRSALMGELESAGHSIRGANSADAVVRGRVARRRLSLEVTLRGQTESFRIAGRTPRQLASRGAARVSRWISSQGEAEPEPAREEERPPPRRERRREEVPDDPYEDLPAAEPGDLAWQRAPRAIELESGVGLFSRRLSFNDDIFSRLDAFEIVGAPKLHAAFAWYPLRHFTSELYAHVGIGAEIETAVLVSSSRGEEQSDIDTAAYAWAFDFRYELPIDMIRLRATLGYGEERFNVDPGPAMPHGTPLSSMISLFYRYLRPSIAGQFFVADPVSFGASFGWRSVLSAGGIDASRGFPASNGGGFDASLSVSLHPAWYIELRLRAEYHRYFFSFDPQPGDYYVVGGALDEWASLGLDVVVALPGVAR